MRIGVIGANGFIGREIYNHLPESDRYMIFRDSWKDIHYDVVIDANGNSMKYLAQSDPVGDFNASVNSVMSYTHNLKYDKYIYISSIDVELFPIGSHYGFHRAVAECVVKHYCSNWTIVRLCSVIGENMKKGIVYDILLGEKIFVKKDSLIQVISAKEVARKIPLILNDYGHETLSFCSKGSIGVSAICDMFGKDPAVDPKAETQVYNSDPSDLGFKTPKEYLKETIYERVV